MRLSSLFVVLFLLSALTQVESARFAWATIYYECGKNDEEYWLAARVLMQSIKDTNTVADRVVLTAKGTRTRYIKGFEDDGVVVKPVDNIDSPWTETLQRFAFSLNKLKIWSLTQYERVIFLDADVIVLQQADFLFRCGKFCAVFFNPINFHTAILIVQPNQTVYDDLIQKLNSLKSFDGADQGFINSYFKGFNAAKEWTKELPASNDEMNRLPVPYNMHHIYYYEKMSWGGPWGKGEDIVTMTYPIATFGKPWWWWCYPLMDMHWLWLKYRNEIDTVYNYPIQMALVILSPAVHFLFGHLIQKVPCPAARISGLDGASAIDDHTVWFVWGANSCRSVVIGCGLSFVSLALARFITPGITPPLLAWTLFLSYYSLFMFHGAAIIVRRMYGIRLRLVSKHALLFAVPWILFFSAAYYPYYPHGLVKLSAIIVVLLTSAFCNVALFKLVNDYNLSQR